MNPINLNRQQLKIAAFGLWLEEGNPGEALKLFKSKFPQKHPSYKFFQRLFKQFRGGHFQFDEKPRSGRPVVVTTESDVEKVKQLVLKDRKISVRKISKILAIKRATARRIISRKLKMQKLRPIRNPHTLTQELMEERFDWCTAMLRQLRTRNAKSSVVTSDETYLFFEQVHGGKEWTFDHEDTPRQTRHMRYTCEKRMYYLFFNSKGIVHVAFRPLNVAANSADYQVQLARVIENLGDDASKIVIHDDNARIHTSNSVVKCYRKTGLRRLTHPRYSPDLVPNDFWLIRKLKRALDGKYIVTEQELFDEVMEILKSIPAREFARCFSEWLIRMQRCIDRKSGYVEYRTRCIKRRKNK